MQINGGYIKKFAGMIDYKIDGKKLIIKDSFGKDVEYTKK